jgi:hypothetical protein
MESTNGIDWDYITTSATYDWTNPLYQTGYDNPISVFDNKLYMFGHDTDVDAVLTSSDYGVTWTKIGDSTITLSQVVVYENKFYGFVGVNNIWTLYVSNDGITWEEPTNPVVISGIFWSSSNMFMPGLVLFLLDIKQML